MRNAFWVLSLGIIAGYLFFFALGAFGFGEVLPLSLAVTVLAALWAVRAWRMSRRGGDEGRDPRLMEARERRGF
jgi:steroid 5-alpha reductase family enzyme